MGDSLAARMQAGSPIAFNTLSDTSTCYYRTAAHSGVNVDWANFQSRSHRISRAGLVGTYMENERLNLAHSAISATQDLTVEVLFASNSTGYNFFGGVWNRTIVNLSGYLWNMGLYYGPINGSISDTVGKVGFNSWDINVSHIASTTVHSLVQATSNGVHHVAYTIDADQTTNAVKLYVDGVNTETYTLTSARSVRPTFDANSFAVGVEEYFTATVGTVSHACITPGILSVAEIKARANLVKELPAVGGALVWDATNNMWRHAGVYGSSAWQHNTKLYGNSSWINL